jgi:capsid protein
LKVIYQDNESKINTMRLMMGEAIVTLVMRCQIAAETKQPLSCKIVWPDFIPVDDKEQTEVLVQQIDAELVDHTTAISELGRDPDDIQERIKGEKEANSANETNVGAMALQNWMNGRINQ